MKLGKFPPHIQNISIFGSSVRGDEDELSDFDILVLVEDGSGTTSDTEIRLHLKEYSKKDPSISWYGEKKLQAMFQSGHLFSWHLFLESQPILPFRSLPEIFGPPSQYASANYDIQELFILLKSVQKSLLNTPENLIFELGLMYVCARNIAMSASWYFNEKPDFGRYSPFTLQGQCFPWPIDVYKNMMQCRMASQRGLKFVPRISVIEAQELQISLVKWVKNVLMKVSKDE